jgi:hypothetical protein
VGNDIPAGEVEDERCRYCRKPLADRAGYVLAQGPAPIVDGRPPTDVNELLDALREGGAEVRVVELSAVRVGEDKLLLSALAEDGELVSAEVCEGERAEAVEHLMDLLDESWS